MHPPSSFIIWAVDHIPSREAYAEPFRRIEAVLARGVVVYVHCKSGKDRASFAVAAYLMIQEGTTAFYVTHALSDRRDHQGRSIANLTTGDNKDNMTWRNVRRIASGRRADGSP